MTRHPHLRRAASGLAAALLLSACATVGDGSPGVTPRLDQLGAYRIEMSAASPEARRWIEQGLLLAYGFEHRKAVQAFEAALREDPQCAMCAWGAAYVLGPNINRPREYVDLDALLRAHGFAQQAQRIAASLPPGRLSERDKDLIAAMAERYEAEPRRKAEEAKKPALGEAGAVCAAAGSPFAGEAQLAHPREQAYARAMAMAFRRHGSDVDVAAMYAESLMMLTPWAWYDAKTKQAHANAAAAIDVLRKALDAAPRHPGLIHFLIHATEQGPNAKWAEAGADRLREVTPGMPHLVHMPSHTYIRIGRYGDAVAANQGALAADKQLGEAIRAQGGKVQGNWDLHHLHFLWFAAAMDGQSRVSIDAVRRLGDAITPWQRLRGGWRVDLAADLRWLVLVQNERWNEALAAEMPAAWFRSERAMAHFARGMAHARGKRQAEEAKAELVMLEALADRGGEGDVLERAAPSLKMAIATLRGEVAWARGDRPEALRWLRRAAELEREIEGGEVASFGAITAPALGSALIAAGEPAEAETVYRQQLDAWPGDPRALQGLARSLQRQGRADEAQRMSQAFAAAWQRADFTPSLR